RRGRRLASQRPRGLGGARMADRAVARVGRRAAGRTPEPRVVPRPDQPHPLLGAAAPPLQPVAERVQRGRDQPVRHRGGPHQLACAPRLAVRQRAEHAVGEGRVGALPVQEFAEVGRKIAHPTILPPRPPPAAAMRRPAGPPAGVTSPTRAAPARPAAPAPGRSPGPGGTARPRPLRSAPAARRKRPAAPDTRWKHPRQRLVTLHQGGFARSVDVWPTGPLETPPPTRYHREGATVVSLPRRGTGAANRAAPWRPVV